LIVMFKGLRIVLRTLLPKRESEVIMCLSKVWIITDRLFELYLGRGELFGVHEIHALVVNFESRTANLLLQWAVHSRATASPAAPAATSAAGAHCSNCPSAKYTNAEIELYKRSEDPVRKFKPSRASCRNR